MSEKERYRRVIMEMVKQGKLTLDQAAKQCEITYRQAKRVYRKYKEEGDAGLVHRQGDNNQIEDTRIEMKL